MLGGIGSSLVSCCVTVRFRLANVRKFSAKKTSFSRNSYGQYPKNVNTHFSLLHLQSKALYGV